MRNWEWDDLDLTPISNKPHINYVYIPERPSHMFRKKLTKLPENKLPYLV